MDTVKMRVSRALTRLELPWMFLGFAYLGIYSIQVIAQPSETVYAVLEAANWAIYGVFALDLLVRALLAGSELATVAGFIAFLRAHWLSILAVVVPAFRSLRVLRVLIVLRAMEPYLNTRSHKLGLVTGVTVPLLLFSSAVAVLEAEQNAEGSNITSFADAIWWALASVTTVGYGDRYPVTDDGRVIATFLLVVGIGLFGALTAVLAAWVLRDGPATTEKSQT